MKNFILMLCFTGVSIACLSQNVVQVEYFIDADAGVGKNTIMNVTPVSDGAFPFNIDLSALPVGYHKLYFRTKDNNGAWSLTARRNVEVLVSQSKTTISRGEYFIDDDPGFGLATPIIVTSPDSIILQNFSAAASALSEGYHKLYGRFVDTYGRWSITFRRNMEIYKSSNTLVTKVEYFFDTDQGFGNCASVAVITPFADGSISFNIPRNQIPQAADTLFLRVQDDIENRWSITQYLENISTALPLTLLNFTATKENNITQLKWQ